LLSFVDLTQLADVAPTATPSQPAVEAATLSLLPQMGAHSAVLHAHMTGACAICEDISSSSDSSVGDGAAATAVSTATTAVEDVCSDDDDNTATATTTATTAIAAAATATSSTAAANDNKKRAKELLHALLTDAADDPATQ
jgi:hypothetical protein